MWAGALDGFALDQDAERWGLWKIGGGRSRGGKGQRPGPEQVDTAVGDAADAAEGEAVAGEGGEDRVLEVGADVDVGGWVEVDAGGVGEEGREVGVVWGGGGRID